MSGAPAPRGPGGPRPSLLFPAIVFVVALGLLLLSGDLRETGRSLASFHLGYVPLVLGLSLVNYGLRFVRWDVYLRSAGCGAPRWPSLVVFASGLAMSVTPGKAGELVKAYGLNRLTGAPVRRVVPVILMERVNDTAGVLLLVALGSLEGTLLPLVVIGAVLLLVHALLLWPAPGRRLLFAILAVGPLVRVRDKVLDAFDALAALARPGPLLLALVLSVVAWGAEGFGLYLIVRGLGGHVGVGASVMAYAVATLVGALSFVPGGLLVTEGSMTAILVSLGLGRSPAALATTLCRVATLWFAVAIGCAALLLCWPRLVARGAPVAPADATLTA